MNILKEALETCKPDRAKEDLACYQREGFILSEEQKNIVSNYARLRYNWDKGRDNLRKEIYITPSVLEFYDLDQMQRIESKFKELFSLVPLGTFEGDEVAILASPTGEIFIFTYGRVFRGGKNFLEFLNLLFKNKSFAEVR